jgi:hypothetical protein
VDHSIANAVAVRIEKISRSHAHSGFTSSLVDVLYAVSIVVLSSVAAGAKS